VIRGRGAQVTGILNGIDTALWDPATDAAIAARYDAARPAGKLQCKRALQAELGLAADDRALLLTVVSRLTAQKGLDLVLAALPELAQAGVQFAVQGTGEPALEAAFRMAQQAHPGRVHVHIGYDEARAHRLVAAADVIAVPSRFEPCGLTQLYGLRYGTLPVVRRTGGLADTVIDGGSDERPVERGTGFSFDAASGPALEATLLRAVRCYRDSDRWRALMRRAMACDFSWHEAARAYRSLYQRLLGDSH